ncbi:putative receptor [Klebsiella quasipneumoniae]|nr:putative receptor [Klebsiella quasipneumoniae]
MRSRSRTWPIVASRNFTLLILQRRLAWLAYSSGSDRLQARASAAPPGDSIRHGVVFMPGGGCALPGLGGPLASLHLAGPRKHSAAWQDIRHGIHDFAGWRLRLTRPTFVRPVINLTTCATETAGADGLNIAETFPEGRGSPHGCGLRAVFCMDAASARPAACRDKSKVPRSGDVAGRSPGVQGAAATGRPPVRSLRYGKQSAEKLTGSAICPALT